MTIQDQISKIEAEIAIYRENKGRYSKYPDCSAWDYYTVRTLKDELKELEDELLTIHMDSLTNGYKK